MYTIWLITFTATRRETLMRVRAIGGHRVELMDRDGNWIKVGKIESQFTTRPINFPR